MNSKNYDCEIEDVAITLLCLSEQMALQSTQHRDNNLIRLLSNLGTRLNEIKHQ